jgi:hypothetical protein
MGACTIHTYSCTTLKEPGRRRINLCVTSSIISWRRRTRQSISFKPTAVQRPPLRYPLAPKLLLYRLSCSDSGSRALKLDADPKQPPMPLQIVVHLLNSRQCHCHGVSTTQICLKSAIPSSANFASSCSRLSSTIYLMPTSERHVQRTVNNGFDLIDKDLFVCSLSPTSLSISTTSPKESSSTPAQHTRDAAVSMHTLYLRVHKISFALALEEVPHASRRWFPLV